MPGGWHIHVVVHEAMSTDERGRLPVARWLPTGLRHRVVEHRATPQQLRGVNWALRDAGVQVPRGGAVVLPGTPAPDGYDGDDFSRPRGLPRRLGAGRSRRRGDAVRRAPRPLPKEPRRHSPRCGRTGTC
ncbi:hypothetical protein [Streptomyces afghaniensis 772] [Streptomyces afghaniensis]